MSLYRAVFVEPWPWWAAGLAIGGFVTALAAMTGKPLGVSSGYGTWCGFASRLPAFARRPFNEKWRSWFLLGLPLGGLAAAAASGSLALQTGLAALSASPALSLAMLFAGGALIGYGARRANGCTSGHSIVGLALGSKASLVATLAFMAAGFAVTHALVRFLGAF